MMAFKLASVISVPCATSRHTAKLYTL